MFVLLYYNYYENENEKLSETEAFNEGTFVELFDTYIYIYIYASEISLRNDFIR